ncbi:Trigger factor [Beijerinckiaceae bacterium RH AL1]|nr:Trigger factor [Beijerinckiaceae bacterium RH CH11]VVB44285.1 Trigger factor [Beijerinckiaceae bacterium RH AL8]VVC54236.1 Trigger factor [Beijerinckiaceae bacterium RH AL1]
MQVTQTHADGLKREFQIVLPAEDLSSRMATQLSEMQAKARIKGFRPGKVPIPHLKRLYGRAIMADVVQEAVGEARTKMIEENDLRVAGEPKFDVDGDENVLERALEAKGDLTFKVALEVLPKVEVGSLDDIEIEKLVADVPEEEVDRIVGLLANQNRTFEPKGAGATAETGDKVTIDFVGKIGDEAFEGGSGESVDLVLGSNSFIPGFEDQIVGMKVDEDRTVTVTFPADYGAANLAGKEANFGVKLKEIAAPQELALDDAFAKNFGLGSFDKLKESIRDNIARDYGQASRAKWKKTLLDTLDKRYGFELPQGLVDQEFDAVWRQVQAEKARGGMDAEDAGKSEDDLKAEYRAIAERRVRLGLVLAEIGKDANVQVTQEEMNQALMERVRQFPGEEKQVFDYFRQNPQAMAQIQAPLFEEKVVDHIVSKAKVTERKVSKDELTKLDEDDAKAA